MSERILVVDDDETSRLVLCRLLTGEGFVTESMANAEDALDHLRTTAFDILLTDLVMAEMSGLELTVAARALHPSLRCMIMSGHPRAEDLTVEVTWIPKPIDIDRLLLVLATKA